MLTPLKASDSLKIAPKWLLVVLLIRFLVPESVLISKESRQEPAGATLLVLDDRDNDDDLNTPPFGDTALLLNSKGELVSQIPKLQVDQRFSGSRIISVSEDGSRFSVVEDSLKSISVYEIASGSRLWSLSGLFNSSVFVDNLVYAVSVDSVYAIDGTGNIVKHSRLGGGIDIAYDPRGKYLWIVGMDVKKCDLDLKLRFKKELPFSTLNSGSFSVDVGPDGSAWLTGRNIYEKAGRGNKLVQMSPGGRIKRVIHLDFCPHRVRINKTDGSVWATGRIHRKDYSQIGNEWPETVAELDKIIDVGILTCTRKYDSKGRLLIATAHGGTSIEVDSTDGSAWIAGDKSIMHYSDTGDNLSIYTGVTAGNKWLAIIP